MILTYILHILVNRIAKRPTSPNNQTHFHFYRQTQFMLYAHNQEKSERLLNNISRPPPPTPSSYIPYNHILEYDLEYNPY